MTRNHRAIAAITVLLVVVVSVTKLGTAEDSRSALPLALPASGVAIARLGNSLDGGGGRAAARLLYRDELA